MWGGATGEGILQSVAERTEVVRAVIEQVKGRARVIVHVAAPATKDAMTLAAEAASLGADAVASVPPFFYKYQFEEIREYYRAIAEASDLPMLVYYIPKLSGADFSLDEIMQLLAIENVIGLKFSDYNLFMMRNIIDEDPQAVVMSGQDQVFLPALIMGARGSIGSTLNFMPKIYIEIYNAYKHDDFARARELQYKANRVITVVIKYGTVSSVMSAMKMVGIDCGAPRRPLPELDSDTYKKMRRELDEAGFFSDPDFGAKP